MLDVGGRPGVAVTLNGAGPYTFILDSGASISVVDPALIEQLGLPSLAGTPGTGPVRIGVVGLGDLTISHMTAGRSPAILAGVSADPPRGVFSALAFPGALVSFDFAQRQIRIRSGALEDADGQRVFAYDETDPLPLVPIRLDGHEFRVHLDTGAPLGISLPTARARELGLDDRLVEKGRVRLATGEFPRYEARFDGVAMLGQQRLTPGVLSFSDMRAGRGPGRGVIGMALLRDFIVTVDSKNRRVAIDRPAASR